MLSVLTTNQAYRTTW